MSKNIHINTTTLQALHYMIVVGVDQFGVAQDSQNNNIITVQNPLYNCNMVEVVSYSTCSYWYSAVGVFVLLVWHC